MVTDHAGNEASEGHNSYLRNLHRRRTRFSGPVSSCVYILVYVSKGWLLCSIPSGDSMRIRTVLRASALAENTLEAMLGMV